MLHYKSYITLIFVMLALPAWAQNNNDVELKSPAGNITFSFQFTRQAPVYGVTYKGIPLIRNSTLGLKFKTGTFKAGLRTSGAQFSEVDDTYHLVVGKASNVRYQHRQGRIPLEETGGTRER